MLLDLLPFLEAVVRTQVRCDNTGRYIAVGQHFCPYRLSAEAGSPMRARCPPFTALQVPDVRDVVKSYDGKDIPIAFRERMKRLQEQQAERQQQQKGFLSGFARR